MRIRPVLSTAVLLLMAGCATTSFQSTYKAPDAPTVEMTGKKVVVVAAGVPTSMKQGVEAAIANELNKLGAQAAPSNQLFQGLSSNDAAKAKLASEGYDAAWVVKLSNREKELSSTPSMGYAPYGAYGSYWGWGGGYGAYGGSEIRTDTKVYIETLVYSVKADKLAWSGMSVTTNPTNVESFAAELTQTAVAEMKKTGLLK